MAQFDARFGTAFDLYFTMIDAGTLDLAVTGDWTPATGDTKVSKDGGDVANTSNNPAVVGGTGSVLWKLTFDATEMAAVDVMVQIGDSATKAVEDNVLLVTTQFGGQVLANTAIDVLQCTNATFTAVTSAAEFFAISPITGEEATASHFVGRNIAPVKNLAMGGGALRGQMTDITSSELANSKIKLGFTPFTEALASADYVVIL